MKSNNQRLKKNVFGPVESARTERLSAKLQELISQPKPSEAKREVEMQDIDQDAEGEFFFREKFHVRVPLTDAQMLPLLSYQQRKPTTVSTRSCV